MVTPPDQSRVGWREFGAGNDSCPETLAGAVLLGRALLAAALLERLLRLLLLRLLRLLGPLTHDDPQAGARCLLNPTRL